MYYIFILDDRIRNTRACPEDATHGGKALPAELWFKFREDGSRSTAVSARGKGVDQNVPNSLHMNLILAISRNSDMLFKDLKFI